MLQKVIQVGNSSAVIVPREVLQQAGLMVGDRIEVALTKKPLKIEVIPRKKILRKTSGITPSFVKSVDQFIRDYRPVLEELAIR